MAIHVVIRDLAPDDNLAAITDLIHQAYATRAASNLRYWATYQTVEDTASRFREGHGLIARAGDQIVGTINVLPPQPDSEVPYYREPTTWSFCQFAVLPALKGQGVGRRLHDAALKYALANGCRVMALDTAAPATDLIEMYLRWGYVQVGECDWRPQTNYVSLVMAKELGQ